MLLMGSKSVGWQLFAPGIEKLLPCNAYSIGGPKGAATSIPSN